MKTSNFLGFSAVILPALASALCASCYHDPPPPEVPGPTVAHPTAPPRAAEIAPADVKIVSSRSADSRIVSFRIAFATGSSDDPKDREGLTNLTADLMTDGGTESLTYAELSQRLFPMAASIVARVERDETVFEAQVTKASLESFVPILRDVLIAPRLDQAGFDRVRARETSSLVDDLRGGNDEALGKEALHALLYDSHPYGHPVVGTEHGLSSATLDDVRAHKKKVFCRERMVIGLAGGFPEGFDKRFSAELGTKVPACDAARAELPPFKSEHGVHVLIVDKPTADATAISIGFRTQLTRASADFPAVAFFTDYLGLHRQSAGVLYHQLRELRGLNYGDYAYSEFFQQEGGVSRFPLPNIVRREQLVSLWIRPVKPKNGIFALRGALDFYSRLLSGGIPKAEIERFREFLSRYIGLEQQTENRRLGYTMDDVAYGLKKPYLDTMRGGWSALDEASLKAATDRWLTVKDISIAIVAKDGEALAAALEKGDASPPTYDTPKPPSVLKDDAEIQKFSIGIDPKNVKVVPVADMFK
ncbi:MAG: pitrilysin family protein [Polyangiaceae bacterium]